MAEFNEQLVLTDPADLDVLPCVDASDQRRLKQLTLGTLKQAIGGGGSAPSNQPPNPTTATAWSQPDPDGGPSIEWVWHPTVERWVSRAPVKLGYFEKSKYRSWYREGHEILTPELLFDSIVVGGYSRGDFDPGERRDIEIHLVDESNQGSLFFTKQLEGLEDEKGFRVREPINLIKPLSDVLYVIFNEEPDNNPPKVERAFVYLFLRAIYDAGN